MGATPKYGLPWPDLPGIANGPIAFENLARATENTIAAHIYTPPAAPPPLIAQVDNNQAVSTDPLVANAVWHALSVNGKSISLAHDSLVTMITNFFCQTQGNSAGHVSIHWDGVVKNEFQWHTRGLKIAQVAGLSQFFAKAGLHSLRIDVGNNSGGSATVTTQDLDWNIYGAYFPPLPKSSLVSVDSLTPVDVPAALDYIGVQ